MKITIRASMPSQAASVSIASRYCSAVAVAIMSTGFAERRLGRQGTPPGAPAPAAGSAGTSRPAASQASAHMIPGPPALVSTPTRRPVGSGWLASSEATSSISARLSVRITPACSKSASTVTSEAESMAPVCELVARAAADRAAALHDDDRLRAADPAGDAARSAADR